MMLNMSEYKDLEFREKTLAREKNMAIISTQMVINTRKVSETILKDRENERKKSLEQYPEKYQYLKN